LHNDQKQTETLRTPGNEEVLQHLPQANWAQGSEIRVSLLDRCLPENREDRSWRKKLPGFVTCCDVAMVPSTLESQLTWRKSRAAQLRGWAGIYCEAQACCFDLESVLWKC